MNIRGRNALTKVKRLIFGFSFVQKILRKFKYPGLSIAGGASFDIAGQFIYGRGCSIGIGTSVNVPSSSSLRIGSNCYVGRHVEIGASGAITIGNDTSIQDRCIFLGDVALGNHCTLAPNVFVSSGRHYFDLNPSWLIRDQDSFVKQDSELSASHSRPVTIEDDCWLGVNVIIMAGVTVGKGAVVGANSVVSRNVEPYTVVAGAPAKRIKERLQFNPPKRISSASPLDLPYFYSGFEVSQSAIRKYSALGGVAAKSGEFDLCLDASSGGALHIVAKSLDDSCFIVFGDERRLVSKDFQEFEFASPVFNELISRCRGKVDPRSATLIIKEAWIE